MRFWNEIMRSNEWALRQEMEFEAAIAHYRDHEVQEVREAFCDGLEWNQIRQLDFAGDKAAILQWFDSGVRSLSLDEWEGVHVSLGDVPEIFAVFGVRFSAEAFVAPLSPLWVSEAFSEVSDSERTHAANELRAQLFSEFPYPSLCSDWAAYPVWLSFTVCTLARSLAGVDLTERYGMKRPFLLTAGFEEDVAACGVLAPRGWKMGKGAILRDVL